MNHLVIVRTGGSVLNIDTYNCQELGLARALVENGWKVSLVMAGYQKEHRRVETEMGDVDVYYVTFKSINQALTTFQGLFPLLEKLKPTHLQIHEFGMWMSFKALRWAKKRKIPTFLIQGSYQTTRKPIFRQLETLFNKSFGKYILKNVNGIGCKSKMASNYVSEYYKRETYLTPIGIDIDRFSEVEQTNWLDKLNIQGKHVLLYVGVLEQRRNPHFLVDLLCTLPNSYVLLIAGNGPMTSEVENRIKELKLSDRCFMLGKLRQEQVPSLYKCADLFLLPSDYEIYGMVILEAMYYYLPVITTRTAGSDVLVKQDFNGYILEKDVNKWKDIIESLINDSQSLTIMKSNAHEWIVTELTWKKAANHFLRLYNSNEYENTISK